jgi:hypothetical protein
VEEAVLYKPTAGNSTPTNIDPFFNEEYMLGFKILTMFIKIDTYRFRDTRRPGCLLTLQKRGGRYKTESLHSQAARFLKC